MTKKIEGHIKKAFSDLGFSEDEIKNYIKQLTNQHESWQIDQAEEAIRLFIYFKNKESDNTVYTDTKNIWKTAADEMKNIIQLKHLSVSTEKTALLQIMSEGIKFQKF